MTNRDKIQIPSGCILIAISIEPKRVEDNDSLSICLSRFASADPSLKVAFDEESGQTILHGVSESHLEAVLDYLNREGKIKLIVGKSRIRYRETVADDTEFECEYTHKKQSGGAGQYAKIVANLRHYKENDGSIDLHFINSIRGGEIPSEYILGIEEGIKKSIKSRVLAGYSVIGVEVELIDGAYHDEDSSVMAFEIAARGWLSDVMKKLKARNQICLLEPIMHVEIVTPEQYGGELISYLHSLRATASASNPAGDGRVMLHADVPLAEMLGFANSLHERTQGTGTFSMSPAYFDKVPEHIVSTIAEFE